MNDLELLAPAGSPEILIAVINAGADAIYVGGDRFGARAYATNFTLEDLLWAIDYVHMCGKKMYLTVNTLLKNQEIEKELYDYILPLYKAGLDAVLVQDYGVLSFLHTHFPDLPLHASTQMTVCSVAGAAYLKSLGVERVVVSRELSLKEMKEIHDRTGVELEAFVHGALCYSYSGMCLFSSILGGRSGNRGRCAQPCRLAYDIADETGILKKNCYILSLKDACNYERIKDLKEAGIYSLKIEGRMKQAEYAYGVTKIYADSIANHPDSNALTLLKEYGNRGGFTNSYLTMHNDDKMVTYQDSSLHKRDDLPGADIEKKRLAVEGYLNLIKGEPMSLTVLYRDHAVTIEGDCVEGALNRPSIKEDIISRVKKTGNTMYDFTSLHIEMDDQIFIPNKALNQLRRDALDALTEELLSSYRRDLERPYEPASRILNEMNQEPDVIASVTNRSQLQIVLESNQVTTVYLNLAQYNRNCYCEELEVDLDLVKKAGKKAYLRMPPILRNDTIAFFESIHDNLKALHFEGFVAYNTDSFGYLKQYWEEYPIVADYGLYAYNNRAVSFLREQGLSRLLAPLELNANELKYRDNQQGEFWIYGRYPLMQAANCICKNTKGCKKQSQWLYLQDRYHASFPAFNQCMFCMNTIYNSLPTNLLDRYEEIRKLGVSSIRLEFTDESDQNVKEILHDLELAQQGRLRYNEKKSYTNGHYKRGIE